MALGARDIFIILRARDEASRTINNVGRSMRGLGNDAMSSADKMYAASAALIGAGTALATAGAAGVAFFGQTIKEAQEFSRLSARTLTQTVGRFEASVDDMKNIARSVAAEVPAPFEQMQETLYFIFSSTNANMAEGKELLRGFAMEAVAGQTDIQAVARSSIAIMNAFNLPASELERIQDMQFETVRKGVITYEELSSVIGRAIPATARAGQDVEMLGAALAFLTRNGLSAEMASTSAARAFEAFARPAVAERLKEMGINIADARGEFRPFNEVITELGQKLESLPGPERAAILHELFKGAGGTIQARRFLDMAVKNYEELNQHVDWQMNNAGAFRNAYNIMMEEPAMKVQQLRNQWAILKTEIGDEFLAGVVPIAQFFIDLINKFRALDPEVKKFIVRFAAISAAIMLVVGTLMVITGVVLGFMAMMSMAGVTLGAILIPIGLVIAAIAALIAIGWLVISNWDSIQNAASRTWDFIRTTASNAWEAISLAVAVAWRVMEPIWNTIVNFLTGVLSTAFGVLRHVATEVWKMIRAAVETAWALIKPIWDTLVMVVRSTIVPAITWLGDNWRTIWGYIRGAVDTAWKFIKPIWDAIVAFMRATFGPTVNFLRDVFRVAWQIIVQVIQTAWSIISAIFQIIMAVIRLTLVPVIEYLKIRFEEVWKAMGAIVAFIWERSIKPIWDNVMHHVRNVLVPTINWLKDMWGRAWSSMATQFSNVWNGILRAATSIGNSVIRVVEGLINNVIGGINALIGLLNKLPGVEIEAIARVSFPRLGTGGGAANNTPRNQQYYHSGGYVEGGDSRGEVDAKLLNREGVINRRGMAAIGKDGLELINRGTDIFRRSGTRERGGFVDDFFNLGKRALRAAYDRYVKPRLGGSNMVTQVIRSLVGSAFEKVFTHTEEAAVPKEFGKGAGGIDGGWRKMWAAVKAKFPFARLTSAYRPGAITATGRRSLHGLGRAIDVAGQGYMNHPQMLQIANWIARTYRATELIYSRGPSRIRGNPWTPTGITRRNHYDHVHWAMAQGGKVLRGPARTLVGEHGPEVLDLPTGSQVTPLDMGGNQAIEDKLDQLIALLADREPVQINVETRDDPYDIAQQTVVAMRMRQ